MFARGEFPPGLLDAVGAKVSTFGSLAPPATTYTMYTPSEAGVRTQFFEAEHVEDLMQRRGWDAAKAVGYLAARDSASEYD